MDFPELSVNITSPVKSRSGFPSSKLGLSTTAVRSEHPRDLIAQRFQTQSHTDLQTTQIITHKKQRRRTPNSQQTGCSHHLLIALRHLGFLHHHRLKKKANKGIGL